MIRNSIRSNEHQFNIIPFQIGSIVDMNVYTHSHMSQAEIATQEPTGLWIITGFNLHQYTRLGHEKQNMWTEPKLEARKIFNDINIELEWFNFAFPHMFAPAWSIPKNIHSTFDVDGNTYAINTMDFDYRDSKYNIRIHQLFKEDNPTCCELHNKLSPSFGSCSISIFDGCGACCSNCPDWNYKDDEREGEDYTQSNRTIEHEN